jgi:hypothetical protein
MYLFMSICNKTENNRDLSSINLNDILKPNSIYIGYNVPRL